MTDPNQAASAPTFSVVIATYARGAMVEATLRSVTAQVLAPHEILVVSDGPAAPGLADAVHAVGGARLIELPVRTRTQAGPNNEGWKQATGDWIAYLGHDDVWHPDHLVALAEVLARRPDAGFAISGLLYLGPDRDDDAETWVTGFFDDDDTRAPFEEFFPPSAIAHRRDLAGPRWPDGAVVTLPVDAEFLRSHAERGTRFVSTRRITAMKFASALRYLSYAIPRDDEQRWMLALSGDRSALDQFLRSKLAIARAQGTFMHIKQVDRALFVPGEIIARSEQVRGIEVGDPPPLVDSAWVPIGSGDRPPDWYLPESDDIFEWRWSGPSAEPKLVISVTAPDTLPVRVGVHVLWFADDELREQIRVRVNGFELPVTWEVGVDVRMIFTTTLREDRASIIEILTGRTSPQSLANDRPVGIAVTGYDLEPQAAFESRQGGPSRASAVRALDIALKRLDSVARNSEGAVVGADFRAAEIEELRSTLHEVLGSRSWRMTGWYRALGARIRRRRAVRPKGFEPPTF